ncbi:Flavin-containing monooxygenase-like [Penicillium digitatum]|nr:Flavin-containing monooxygenase-like [Penicillium digitatum]
MVELKGHEENKERPFGARHGEQQGRKNWKDRRIDEINFEGKDPAVLILGMCWAGWLDCCRASQDAERSTPLSSTEKRESETTGVSDTTSSFSMTQCDNGTETRTLHPRHIIQATGQSGKKHLPAFKGMEDFSRDRIFHSSEHPGANPESMGKKTIVVGSCNSANDIAQDFVERGYDVTMVQRSSTCVVSSDSTLNIAFKGLYDATGPPTEDADLYPWSIPSRLFKAQQAKVTQVTNQNDAKTIEGLDKAGFKVDSGPSDSGILMKYFQRGGGYYIDVGGSQLTIDGKVKIKHGQETSQVLPHGLRFADGSELEADEIVFATGYQNMRTETRVIFGDKVADRVGDIWGLDKEGEMRTIWRRSGHPGFWFMGGNLAMSRYYSRLLALQIKALEEGVTSW